MTGLLYKKWLTDSPDHVIVLVHGMGAHSGRWKFAADHFNSKNISCYSIELKGFGEAEGLKGHIDSFGTYYKDLFDLINIARKENPDKKIYVLAESMGGLIAFMTAVKYQGSFDGLIAISPAFANGMNIPALTMFDMAISLSYNPKKQFIMPFDARMCTRDEAFQKIMDSDPREHRFASAKLLIEIVFAQILSSIRAVDVKMPVLFLLAGVDKLTDPKAAKKVFKKLKNDKNRLIEYKEMYHALSIDTGRENVFEDIISWIKGLDRK